MKKTRAEVTKRYKDKAGKRSLTLDLTAGERERLEACCKHKGVTLVEFLRQAITEYHSGVVDAPLSIAERMARGIKKGISGS